MPAKDRLLNGIAERDLKVVVLGIGYVGLPLAVAFAEAGFRACGVDISSERVDSINRGQSYIEDIPTLAIKKLVEQGRLWASTDFAEIVDADAIIICVPTPLRKTKDPDITYIIDAADKIAEYGCKGKLVILESTTYPGTTEEVVMPRLSSSNHVGQDYFLAFSPERIDPGRSDFVLANTPKVVGGVTDDCLEVAVALYDTIVEETKPVSSTRAAEMVKLLENTFRAVNIGLVNEVALICDKLDLDVWEVVGAAATKPYGFMPFYPGPGLGGHCIPIDPHYLSWKLRGLNYTARFIELASEINGSMPQYVTNKVAGALNQHAKPLKGSKIVILGVAYKPNVSDIRESPALDVIHLLNKQGAEIFFHDPFVIDLEDAEVPAQAVELTAENLNNADCVVVITNHDGYDWRWVTDQSRLIVDTRNALHGLDNEHIVRL
ncbi:MAG: nucleotide sugar dehydrogenase [Candidatus Promineifilaceae bacterium]